MEADELGDHEPLFPSVLQDIEDAAVPIAVEMRRTTQERMEVISSDATRYAILNFR
jgi:hypothetical protein